MPVSSSSRPTLGRQTFGPFTVADGAVLARVRVAPKASAGRLCGPCADANGSPALKVAVAAAPEGGKANAALVQMLARAWDVPKSSVTVVAGARDRRKTVGIRGDVADLAPRLRRWAAANGFSEDA